MKIIVQYQQDGAGGHLVNWPTNVHGAGAVSAAPNARTVQLFSVYPDSNAYAINDQLIINGPGYMKLPSGIIIQWGSGSTTSGQGDAVAFPVPFPTALNSLQITEAHAAGWGSGPNPAPTIYGWSNSSTPLTSFLVYAARIQVTGTPIWSVNTAYDWIAIGL